MALKEAEVVAQEAARQGQRPEFSFPVDIYDDEEEVVLIGDLPGVAPDGVEVHLEKGTLTVRGEVSPFTQAGEPVLEEYRTGNFVRTFTVSEEIDPEGIKAELRNGVLTLRLPKSESRKPRRIQVR